MRSIYIYIRITTQIHIHIYVAIYRHTGIQICMGLARTRRACGPKACSNPVWLCCSFSIIIPRARAGSRGLFTRAMPVRCSPQIDQLGQSCFVGPFLGHLGLSWAILASSWHDLWSSWCQEAPPTSKMSLSAPPGGADDIVNYEVFGTSSYLGHLRVSLAILGPS